MPGIPLEDDKKLSANGVHDMQRGGSRLRLTSAGMSHGKEAEQPMAILGTPPEDAAVLKQVGLTSDEESRDDAWGSSGEEDEISAEDAQKSNADDLSLGELDSIPASG